MVFGETAAAPAPDRLLVAIETALPEWAVSGQEVPVAWTLHNAGGGPISNVQLRLHVPAGCGGADELARVERIPAGGRWTARFSLRMPTASDKGRHAVAITPEVSYSGEKGRQRTVGAAQEMLLTRPLEITAPAEPVRLGARDSREVALGLRNWSATVQSAWLKVDLPAGIAAELLAAGPAARDDRSNGAKHTWKLPAVEPGQTVDLRLRLTTEGQAKGGLHPAAVRITGEQPAGWSPAAPLPIAVGPVLVEDNSYPTFGEYVIYAPRYTLRMSKRYGTSRFLHDDAGRPRHEATFWSRRPPIGSPPDALPRLRVGDEDALAWGVPANFLWPTAVPAAVTVLTPKSRVAWSFEDDAVRIEPVAMWSAEAPHEFIFPGQSGWTCWGRSPEWLRIVVVDGAGRERLLAERPQKDQEILIRAAALQVPGYDEAICFAVDRPQKARFDGASIRISVRPGEAFWFGLARPDRLDAWRQSRIKK